MSLEHAVSASYALQTAKLDNILIQRIVIQMLGKAKKFLVTTEILETVIFRQMGDPSNRGCCTKCSPAAVMITMDAAVAVSGVGMSTIFRLAESGKVHHAETGAGHLLVCLNTLIGTAFENREESHTKQ